MASLPDSASRWPCASSSPGPTTLDPHTRHDLGSRLAADVAAYVAPRPPPGTDPHDFLAAVIASRRERDSARLGREAALRARLTREG